MQESLVWKRGVILGVLVFLSFGIWIEVLVSSPNQGKYFEAHFLNVGQGDATFFETPDDIQVLIDGGRDASVLRMLASVMGFFDRTIDIVIATHPDSDHIAGLVDVLTRYEVKKIVITENESDTPTAAAFAAAAKNEAAEIIYARAGQEFQLGASTTLTILFPDRNPAGFESNASSIISKVQYGEIGFIVTGDAPQSIEEYIVRQYGDGLESEVMKVGHHGSDTSTASSFLTAVSPSYAIISAGLDNSYGHPHKAVINRLQALQLTILETAKEGTITFKSDGQQVWVK